MLAWHLLCLHCHIIDANLTRLIFADWMLHLFAFPMGLVFAFLFSVTDCHDNIMVLAGLLSIVVLCALHFSLFHLSCGWNLVAFRCILSVAFLLILGVAFLLVLSVAFHIRHFSLHILVDGCALFLGLIRALGLILILVILLSSGLPLVVLADLRPDPLASVRLDHIL